MPLMIRSRKLDLILIQTLLIVLMILKIVVLFGQVAAIWRLLYWNSKNSMKVKSMRLLLLAQTNHVTLIAYLLGYLSVTSMLFYHI